MEGEEADAAALPVYGDAAGRDGAGAYALGDINEYYHFP